jgi:uncharacterized protein
VLLAVLVAWAPWVATASPRVKATEPVAKNVLLEVKDVIPLGGEHGHVVMLVSKDEDKVLPILVDTQAAVAIAFRLAHREAPYPLSEDLLEDVVRNLGGQVTLVELQEVDGKLFRTRVTMKQGGKQHQFSARPSDSIALALTSGAKIFASPQVMKMASISREDLLRLHAQPGPSGIPEDARPGIGGSGPESDAPSSPRLEL